MRNHHFLTLLIVVAALALAPLSVARAQSEPDAWTTGRLNLRAGPGTEFDVLGQLQPGAGVVLEARSPDFGWLLALAADRSARGWIASGYVTLRPGFAVDRLPVSEDLLDPDAGLPPFTSPKILALFEEVRARAVAADPSAAPVVDAADTAAPEPGTPDVPKQAEASPVLLPKTSSEGGSALDASLREEPAEGGPRYVAPIALGGAAVVAAAFGGIMGIQARQAETEANAAFYEADAIALGQKAQRNATLANVGFGVALAAATGAVITFLLTDGAEAEPAR